MKVNFIKLLDQEHPLCFSMAAAEALSDHFGSLKQMAEELDSKDMARVVRASDKVLQVLLKAGRIYHSACGIELPPPIPCRPADLIDLRDRAARSMILEAITADTNREVEVETKNPEATPGD